MSSDQALWVLASLRPTKGNFYYRTKLSCGKKKKKENQDLFFAALSHLKKSQSIKSYHKKC